MHKTLDQLKADYLALHWTSVDDDAKAHLNGFAAFAQQHYANESPRTLPRLLDKAPSAPGTERPEFIQSAMGDKVFDGDDGYEELLADLRTTKPAGRGTDPDPAAAARTETKVYADGTTATGPGPLPDHSPGGAPVFVNVETNVSPGSAPANAEPPPPAAG